MLVIRLQRTGRENTPTYRIVVAEKTKPVKGKIVELLGHYLPAQTPAVIEVKNERVNHWVSKGAAASDTVARLLSKAGIQGLEKYVRRYTKRKSKNAPPEAPAAPAAPASAPPAAAADDKAAASA